MGLNAMQTGLLHRLRRVRRQVSDQHRHLRAIRAELMGALASGVEASATEALHSYREAIHAHFALENETFFPALHGLRPECCSDLDHLGREHGVLLSRLENIQGALVTGELRSSADAIQAFNSELAQHEHREEALMAQITGDFPSDPADIDSNPPST
jgi:hypothetical protein